MGGEPELICRANETGACEIGLVQTNKDMLVQQCLQAQMTPRYKHPKDLWISSAFLNILIVSTQFYKRDLGDVPIVEALEVDL